jgi:nitroreductase
MNVSEAIRTKRSVRQFRGQQLAPDEVRAILNAGRRAQSSKNTQPWQFIAVQDRETLRRLSETGQWAGHLAGAALGVAILTPDPSQRWSVMFDAGQSAAYMQLAAWEMGIGSVIAAVYEPEQAREILGVPAEWHVRAILSFGYPADESALTAPPKPGGRSKLEDVVHYDRW